MTLRMTSAQVVETSVIVNNNSSFQNYTDPDDPTQQIADIPGFKPFTVKPSFTIHVVTQTGFALLPSQIKISFPVVYFLLEYNTGAL